MILKIATIRIKLSFEHDYDLDTEYITKIKKLYRADDADGYDFEVKTIKGTIRPSKLLKMEKRNGALYGETSDIFTFETKSWASVINWKDTLMTTMIFDKESTECEDRLFLRSLKLLISLLALRKGGLPFHCSAVMNKNQYSILFSGQSSAGKTTVALFLYYKWKWNIFNDEFNIIMPINGTYYACSTPFTSLDKINFCSYGIAPIIKLFHIKKDMNNRAEEMTLKQKYFYLLAGAYTFPTSESFGKILMETTEKIARNIPMQILYLNHKRDIEEQIDTLVD